MSLYRKITNRVKNPCGAWRRQRGRAEVGIGRGDTIQSVKEKWKERKQRRKETHKKRKHTLAPNTYLDRRVGGDELTQSGGTNRATDVCMKLFFQKAGSKQDVKKEGEIGNRTQ